MAAGNPGPLVAITAPFGSVEIRGPHAPVAGLMKGVDIPVVGRLVVTSDHTPITSATYVDAMGSSHQWDPATSAGPVLFEDTTYQLYAAGADYPPHPQHRDPTLLRDIATHPRERVSAGTLNFGRQVGQATLEIRFGPEVLHMGVEVVPTKIDYASDYQQLRRDVEAAAHGLALAYLRSTSQRGGIGDESGSELDWLTILRQEVSRLQQAVERINRYPHRQLTRQLQEQATHRIKRPDAVARRAVMRGKGSGGYDQAVNIGPVRQIVPTIAARTTLDTPEHRWLALQLSAMRQRLEAVGATLDLERNAAGARTPTPRRQAERAEVDRMLRQVGQMLDTECLQAASQLPQPNPPSLTLLTAPGYREAHQILTMVRLALSIQGDALELQSKDIHQLYEIWSFLEIVRIAAACTCADVTATPLIHHYRNGLRIGLRSGSMSDIDLRTGHRTLTLSYNRTYPGQTGSQRPDIVLRIQQEGEPDLVIVLDAKYRVDATADYRTTFGAPGPPIDAINALHRYRDAIVTQADTRLAMRPVVRGAALFPLTAMETTSYPMSSLYASLDSLGIGALPFLPGNTELVEQWLDYLLGLPTHQLAWNGPPGPAKWS